MAFRIKDLVVIGLAEDPHCPSNSMLTVDTWRMRSLKSAGVGKRDVPSILKQQLRQALAK